MQVLGLDPLSRTSAENNNSNDISQANSAMSIDYQEQIASTIGNPIFCHPLQLSNKIQIKTYKFQI